MIGYFLLAIFSIYLFKNFWKTSMVVLLWCPVFLHVNIGGHWNLYGLLSIVALFLFFLKEKPSKRLNNDSFPFLSSYFLLILSFLFAGIKINIGSISAFVGLFLFPFLSWIAKDRINNYWKFILINLTIFVIIIISIGFVELSLGFNPAVLYLDSKDIMSFVEQHEDYIRFGMYRCRSLTAWCSTYGVNCGYIMITFLMCNYYRRFVPSLLPYILCVFLLVGVISSGTRSVYTAVIIGILPLLLNYLTKLKYIVLTIVIAILIYTNNQEMFDDIIESFVHSDEAGGSSTEMRMSQFQAAYNYYIKHPLFGNGIGAVDIATQKNAQLLGAESCIFTIMIDRGLFGFVAYGYFNLQMFYYLWKTPKYRILIFIPLGILIGKIISLFPDIDETYPILWLSILVKAIDDFYFENYDKNKIEICCDK